jgi:5-methylthioadenosine/S-adenosylhomocysteine deaminase
MKILIKNGYVVSMNSDIKINDILIEDDRIKEIGKINDEADKIIDATGMAVMPGLINAHAHSAMSIFRGYADDMELMQWLNLKIWPIEAKMTREDVYYASMLAGIEMIKSGTTMFNDQYFFEEETAKMAEELGMRAMLAKGIVENENTSQSIEEGLNLYKTWNDKANGRIKICMGPHAPYTCIPDTIKKCVDIAKKYNIPIHIHYLESRDEIDVMKEKYNTTTSEYFKEYGIFDVPVILAHGVQVNKDDIEYLKNIKGGVVHNPISNQKLGSGLAPILELKENNINVALGTDGPGSTNTLDMFEEIKFAAYLQKGSQHNSTAISAYEVLKMATIDGAKVLGLENEIGSLEIGKKADIIIVNLNKTHLSPVHDIYSTLAYSVNGADVETTIIDGNIIMENRVIPNINEAEIIAKCNKIVSRLF